MDLTREGYLISLNLAIAGYGSGLVGLLSSYWFKLLAAYMYLKKEGRPFPIVNFCSLWMSDSLFGDFEHFHQRIVHPEQTCHVAENSF